MTATFQRPYTAAERAELSRAPGLAPSWLTGIAGALGAGIIAFLLLLLGLSFLPSGANVAPPGALSGGLLVGATYWTRSQQRERRRWNEWRREREATLAEGLAQVTRFHVRDAIAIEEAEDEGLGYYLQLTNGRVLYLGGQYLYDLAEERRFPATDFEIAVAAGRDSLLSLTPTGVYLAPSSTRPPFTAHEWDAGLVPEDRAFVARPFEELRRAPV
jgi:hypothetical protein